MTAPEHPLDELRQRIDDVDRELLRLFEARMGLARGVAQVKMAHDMPIYDEIRERRVIEDRVSRLHDAALAPYAETLFRELIDASKDAQRDIIAQHAVEPPQRAAYQGIGGAFGEEATIRALGEAYPRTGYASFQDVFQAVWRGEAAYGVVPVENSSTGGIDAVYDLFEAYPCAVVGEVLLRIEHCLLGVPGARVEGVRRVVSHEQSLRQCQGWLKAHHPDWELCPVANNAVAAKMVADGGDRSVAAIAGRRAAALYGLDRLAEDIHDRADNHTRFFVLAREPLAAEPGRAYSLVFELRHEPAALYRALTPFATRRINLTRIESRPARTAFTYRFYVDLNGDASVEDMRRAIEECRMQCLSMRVLGNYPQAVMA